MSIRDAAIDIRYLLDRGYPQHGAVRFVCDHFRLDEKTRHLLLRTVVAGAVSEKRQMKFLPCDAINGERLVIDGYNIIIGMESILEKKAFLCDDGVIRDIKGTFRNFRMSEITERAIEFILRFLKEKNPANVDFLFDSQISKSGLLSEILREKMGYYGLKGDAKTSIHVDHDLKVSKDIVATSDGVVIDEAERVVNLLWCIVSNLRSENDQSTAAIGSLF